MPEINATRTLGVAEEQRPRRIVPAILGQYDAARQPLAKLLRDGGLNNFMFLSAKVVERGEEDSMSSPVTIVLVVNQADKRLADNQKGRGTAVQVLFNIDSL